MNILRFQLSDSYFPIRLETLVLFHSLLSF